MAEIISFCNPNLIENGEKEKNTGYGCIQFVVVETAFTKAIVVAGA